MTPSKSVRRWQIALLSVGVLGLLVAAGQFLALIPPTRWLGVAVWLLGALVIHDAVLAFGVLGASILVRRLTAPIPFAVVVIVQGAAVVAAVVTLLVIPEIIKKAIGSANPSILPLDYLGNLGLFYLGMAVGTGGVVAAYFAVRMLRTRAARTS